MRPTPADELLPDLPGDSWSLQSDIGCLMAILARGKIAYGKWVGVAMPSIAMWFGICIIALVVRVSINWSRFERSACREKREISNV